MSAHYNDTGSGAFNTNDTNAMPDRDPVTGEKVIYVCHGRQCGRHAKYIMERLEQVRAKGVKVAAKKCLCFGQCEKGANVQAMGKVHNKMNPISVATLAKGMG